MTQKVLVTGGAGYVGSTLVSSLLAKDYKVRVLDNLMYGGESMLGFWSHPAFEFVRGDIRDRQLIRSAIKNVDSVVHLAAIVGDPACAKEPETARSVNLDASLGLLNECKKEGVKRLVFASTCSNYGKMEDPSQLVDETSKLRPVSLYAETKVNVERAIFNPDRTDAVCATSLRFATVFGVSARMRFDLTVNHFTMEMLANKHLVVYGEQFWRPYVHVRDIARAVSKVLEAPGEKVNNQVFNVGATDQNYQKQKLVEVIQKYVPDATVEYVHKEEDPRDYRVSFAKIKDTLSFDAMHSVEAGIGELVNLARAEVIENWKSPKYRN